jgi:alanine dehydrogenase
MKLYLSEEDVVACLSMPKAIELVESAFQQLAAGTAINHPRRRIVLPTGSVLHYMAAGTSQYFGIKVYSANAKSGVHFEFLLYRSDDGMPLATIEANRLGQIRTGAATGVATKFLAREDATVVGVIGSGFQAETQLEAVAAVRRLTEVRVWSRHADKRETFAARMSARLGILVLPVDTARECVDSADIVVTMTASKTPVLESAWIAPGTHINAAGSNWANRRELPTDLVIGRASLVAVDSVEVGAIESGDLIIAQHEKGAASLPAVEMSGIIAGKHPGRTSATDITVFKSNGLAVEDVVAAGWVYEESLRPRSEPGR